MENSGVLSIAVRNLEGRIKDSEIASYSGIKRSDSVSVLVAYAVVKGAFDVGTEGYESGYDGLMREHQCCLESVEGMRKRLQAKTFPRHNSVDRFFGELIKKLQKRLESADSAPTGSLLSRAITSMHGIATYDQMADFLNSVGKDIRKHADVSYHDIANEERFSPNYMAEISAIYRIFAEHQVKG